MLLSSTLPAIILHAFLFSIVPQTAAHPLGQYPHQALSLSSRNTPYRSSLKPRSPPSVEARSTRLHRREVPGAVYICTEPNFRGDCSWTSPNNDCHIPGTGTNSPQSIGPDRQGFCILFEQATCAGNQIETIKYPGLSSDIPQFGGLKCFAEGNSTSGNATSIVQNGGSAGSGIVPVGNDDADPRLAGGVGSAERKKLQEVMAEMEKDGFKQGLIGLKKGHYY